MNAMRADRGRMKEEPIGNRETTRAQHSGNTNMVANEQDEKVSILDAPKQTADDEETPDAIMIDGPPIPATLSGTDMNGGPTNNQLGDSTFATLETGPATQGDSQVGLNDFETVLPGTDNINVVAIAQGLPGSNSDFKVGTVEDDELDSLFLQNDGPDAGGMNLNISADSQQEPDVNSLSLIHI